MVRLDSSSSPGLADLRGLTGRVALITGAGGGIGRAIAGRLALEGALVIAADQVRETAADTAGAIAASGRPAEPLGLDITSEDELRRVIPFAVDRFGRSLDVVVACAGVQTFADILELPLADWDRIFDVNARGTFLTMRMATDAMKDGRGGAIVTIASIQARLGSRYYAHYSASKAAVLSLTKSFAVALAPMGIRVNAVAPGIVDTDLWRKADTELARMQGLEPGEPRRRRVAQVPLGRPGTPDDVAAAVAFLASRDAAYITGECIHVCGGDLML
jgi:NAD(P)-dependent dehydrogenase (short-subunit alcohol dehydrogenase family)